MALQWTTTSRTNMAQGVKVLTWGRSGLGKTSLCATAPAPIILSAESGLLSLTRKNIERMFGVNTAGITYDIPVIQVTTVADLTEAYSWLTTAAEARAFHTVCLDSISEIGEVVLNNAKRSVKDPRQAYGVLIEQMETAIRMFRDLPGKHVYMTAKEEMNKDEGTGINMNGPSMPGTKLGQKLPYFFDEVFRIATNKTPEGVEYRYLQTQPDLQNIAKDRSGALDKMEMPHLTHVFNKILQGV